MKDVDLAIHFFLQLAIILAVCQIVGFLGRRFLGQAQVVGEMIAGVILGPSVLGSCLPQFEEWLFPRQLILDGVVVRHPSMQILYVVSQLGLILYMFCVGLEFNVDLLKKKTASAFGVSFAGIVLPFILGAVASIGLHGDGTFFPINIDHTTAALYLGAAMCITAFPMLARILYERGIAQTPMGTLALAAAAFDDAFAWCLLAVVLSISSNSPMLSVIAIGGALIFAVFMFLLGRKLLAHLESWTQREGKVTQPILGCVLLILLLGAWYTDAIRIYAVFGAFIVGACMPRGLLSETLRATLDNFSTVLLLPLFFTYSGINTQISLLNSPSLWLVTGLLCLVAILGKGVGCMVAARLAGESWRNAAAIGSLMNARGLIELIILNFGLQAGVITPTLFTIMVLMAIITTLMASPIFESLMKQNKRQSESN